MAQLQLLRDAMWSGRLGIPYLVHIWFNFAEADNEDWAYVYWVSILLMESERVTVNEFRGRRITSNWYYHDGGTT